MVFKIGRFQMENLVRQKIGFTLLNFSVAPLHEDEPLFINAEQITEGPVNVTSATTATENYLKSKDLTSDAPFVLICPDGVVSEKIAELMIKQGFVNVYVIKDGYSQMKKEKYC